MRADAAGLLEALTSAIDALLALDATALSDDELDEVTFGLQRQRARLGIAAAAVTTPWELRGGRAADGSRSAAHRLARETHCSVRSAKREVRRARQLSSMPHTKAAVLDGRLSLEHVDLLGRANQPWRNARFEEHEAHLVEQCATARFVDAVKIVKYWCRRADAEVVDDEGERQQATAHVHASTTYDGMVVIDGELDPIGGAIVVEQLDRITDELRLSDHRDGIVRTAGQRRAAALVEMARRAGIAPADGRAPAPLFTALVGDGTLAELCELSTGIVVTPGQLGRWIDDAMLETVLFDGPTTVLSVSRRRRFSGAVRRAIEVRDRRCQHPSGCDEPASRCDVDHIVPHAELGETSQFNGRLECPTHNRRSDRHDHGAAPLAARPVTRLDEIRARLRWQFRRELTRGDPDDASDSDDDAGDESAAS